MSGCVITMQAFTPPSIGRRPHPTINPHVYHKDKNKGNTLIVVGVVLVLVTIVAIIALWGGDSTDELMLNIVSLRKGPTEVVKRSALITRTNEIIDDIGNKRIKSEWDGLADCMTKGCTDIDYYNFLVTVITQKNVKHGDLLYNLILVNKYWGTAEIIDFSQATTNVENEVKNLGSREVSKKWSEIIQCDGKCDDKDDLFFQMIKLVVLTN